MILAGFLVRVGLPVIPWAPLREAYLFGFVVGAFSWELLPIVFPMHPRTRANITRFGLDGKLDARRIDAAVRL